MIYCSQMVPDYRDIRSWNLVNLIEFKVWDAFLLSGVSVFKVNGKNILLRQDVHQGWRMWGKNTPKKYSDSGRRQTNCNHCEYLSVQPAHLRKHRYICVRVWQERQRGSGVKILPAFRRQHSGWVGGGPTRGRRYMPNSPHLTQVQWITKFQELNSNSYYLLITSKMYLRKDTEVSSKLLSRPAWSSM